MKNRRIGAACIAILLTFLMHASACGNRDDEVVVSLAMLTTGVGRCPAFADDQACVCTDAAFQGQCVLLNAGTHFYPNAALIGVPDNWISSIATGASVKARYCVDSEMRGACQTLAANGRLSTMTGNPGNDSVSSMRIDRTVDDCKVPKINQVSLFADASFLGDCSVLSLPTLAPGVYGEADFPDTSSASDANGLNGSFGLPNDSVSSLKTGSGVRAVLFADARFANVGPSLCHDQMGSPFFCNVYSRQTVFEPDTAYSALGATDSANSAESANANDSTSAVVLTPYAQGLSRIAFNYKTTQPSGATPEWSQDADGLAHDKQFWYVTNKWNVFRYHLADDLGSTVHNGMFNITNDSPYMAQHGCNHFGDPEVASVNGQKWLFVPVEGCTDPNNSMAKQTYLAVFDLNTATNPMTLHCIDELYHQPTNAGFVAIDPKNQSLLLSPAGDITSDPTKQLFTYTVHYENLPTCDIQRCLADLNAGAGWSPGCLLSDGPGTSTQPLQISSAVFSRMATANIAPFAPFAGLGRGLDVGELQGGVFSPDGKLFYMTNGGSFEGQFLDWSQPASVFPFHRDGNGLRVFDTTTPIWTEIVRAWGDYYGYFSYVWNPDVLGGSEEPEGLDYLDMGTVKGGAFSGQLHALLYANLPQAVFLKHYSTAVP